MSKQGPSLSAAVLAAALVVLATAGVGVAAPTTSPSSLASPAKQANLQSPTRVELAQSGGTQSREPKPPPHRSQPRNSFNDEYVFGLSRGVADSTMHPAMKILVFPITVPLDFLLLPFEVIGGLF